MIFGLSAWISLEWYHFRTSRCCWLKIVKAEVSSCLAGIEANKLSCPYGWVYIHLMYISFALSSSKFIHPKKENTIKPYKVTKTEKQSLWPISGEQSENVRSGDSRGATNNVWRWDVSSCSFDQWHCEKDITNILFEHCKCYFPPLANFPVVHKDIWQGLESRGVEGSSQRLQ